MRLEKTSEYFLIVVLSVIVLYALYNFLLWLREFFFLKKTLVSINGHRKIKGREDLIRIKNYLQQNIHCDADKRDAKRPLLRHTAYQILKMNYGFCGENARVAILLLLYGGVRANRLYLVGAKWKHVLVEQQWKDTWYAFDGHNHDDLKMNDDHVMNIPSTAVDQYPNKDLTNPWKEFSRVQLFLKIPFLKSFAKLRLPKLFVFIFESPDLIKLLIAVFIFSIILFFK